ncbi:peptide chain release factor N(5)-glutamine methyltransferase [Alishewanella tabrizica]|uniref:Release factor glutamine methyltransferase n=1 Tax=Alishewanella tabrizica TaxID=671278 RepID=A0ABQ2WEJ5_9ALTE|nr:peptide chain release factor N(5)-glutamine methyltransferase [Alishewanella tabrizica]GGW51608.1 release factor glutamine methyltransferase [Alishewanella tabrizica]
MTLALWLQHAAARLVKQSDQPLHEAQLMLCRELACQKSYLYTYPERLLDAQAFTSLEEMLQRREQGEPLAYIFGEWHFYGLPLAVAPCTLIPRPDTEILVEQALRHPLPAGSQVLDLGTGTGAIALALAANRPDWQLTAVDYHPEAVALAQRNAAALALNNVNVLQSSWFSGLPSQQFALIVSNPPYIEPADPHLQALTYEPLSALVANEQGLADLQHIVQAAPAYLLAGGWLWLEHGYNQADAVKAMMLAAGFSQVSSVKDYGNQWRITGGQLI